MIEYKGPFDWHCTECDEVKTHVWLERSHIDNVAWDRFRCENCQNEMLQTTPAPSRLPS